MSVVGGNHSGYGGLGDLVLEMEHHFTAIAADVTSNLVRAEAGDLVLEKTISDVYYSFSYSLYFVI